MDNMLEVKFFKTHEDAVLPKSNNADDTGYDIVAVEDAIVPAKGAAVVSVGLTLAYLTPGYWFRIEPRSGLGFKHNIQPHLGIIDNPYRGSLGVKLYNFGDVDYQVKKGDRIAQMVFYPVLKPVASFTDNISETARGANGFGSSGR